MKKITVLFLCMLVCVFSLVSCGESDSDKISESETDSIQADTEAETKSESNPAPVHNVAIPTELRDENNNSLMFDESKCSIKFNMAGKTENADAAYEVFQHNEKVAIRISLEKSDLADGLRLTNIYLVNGANGWTYFGESIGTAHADIPFQHVGDATLSVKCSDNNEPAVAVKTDDYDEPTEDIKHTPSCITVHSVTESQIEFDIFLYREVHYQNIKGERIGNLFFFEHDESRGKTYGYVEFDKNNVATLTVCASGYEDIESDVRMFVWSSQSSEEKQESQYRAMLVFNSQSKGWIKGLLTEKDKQSDAYMYFNNNGTMFYWTKENGYIKTNSTYKLDGKILYIGGDAYDVYMVSTGFVQMTLEAKGKYKIDFSGNYVIDENDFYQVLINGAFS